jgi:putative tryptophan/tyrosine transport system substrate-binding protein
VLAFADERGGDFLMIRRRDFIAGLGGAVAWPLAARTQQRSAIARVGVLLRYADSDPETKGLLAGFRQGLEKRGWQEGRNIQLDFGLGVLEDPAAITTAAKELLSRKPDVVLSQGVTLVAALQKEGPTTPIVFVQISDPVGSGFIASLARPGGNITGLAMFEVNVAAKWLQILKEIVPGVSRVALIMGPLNSFANYLRTIEAIASSLGVELVFTPVADSDADIRRAIESFAAEPNGGLVLPPDFVVSSHRDLVIALAARHRLPAVYGFRVFVTDGGLLSYATDLGDMYRLAAGYVDRILRGDKPADLPVQAPVKYETVLNLKTARALDLTVPPTLLVGADEVIE